MKEADYDLVVEVNDLRDVVKGGWKLKVKNRQLHAGTERVRDQLVAKREALNQRPPAGLTLGEKEIHLDIGSTKEISNAILETKNKCFVGVMGLFDRGKTFILSHLSNIPLASGKTVQTKGLSFKSAGPDTNYVLIDTAGTNAPLETKAAQAMELDESEVLMAKKGVLVREQGLPTRQQETTQQKLEEAAIFDRKVEKAIVNKKSVELFLQEMAFHLSDLLLVVVNEMNWGDQQYLKAIGAQLKRHIIEFNQKNNSTLSRKHPCLMVVHNFKHAVTEQEFLLLRKKYVEDCHVGNYSQDGFNGAECYHNLDRQMVHFFLAKEGSPAGEKYNERTFQAIRKYIRTAPLQEKLPLLDLLADEAHILLKSFMKELKSVHLTARPHLKKALRAGPDSSVAEEVRPDLFWLRAVGKPTLIREEIVYDGVYISLSRSSRFEPMIDTVIYKPPDSKKELVLVVEVPGAYEQGLAVTVTENSDKREFTIHGTRQLSYRHTAHNPKEPVQIDTKRNDIVYSRDQKQPAGEKAEYSLERVERKEGEFSRTIKVPNDFDLGVMTESIYNGILQINIPEYDEEEEVEDD